MNADIHSETAILRVEMFRRVAISGILCALLLASLAATAVAYSYTFNDNDEHLVASLSSGSSSANLSALPDQVFALTNSTGTMWAGMKMRLDGTTPYGDFCCEGFSDYDGPGLALYSDVDGDSYGRAEIMRILALRIGDGSTLDFEVDIPHIFPEGLTDLDIYADPLPLVWLDFEIDVPFDPVILHSADADGLVMARQPVHLENLTNVVWTEYHLHLEDLSGANKSPAALRFWDTDGDFVIYRGPGTPSFHDLDGAPGPEMLVIRGLNVQPGQSLDIEIDYGGNLTSAQANFQLVGRSVAAVTAVENDVVRPKDALNVTFDPNPFNPATNISFTLPSAAKVSIDVFNARGRRVRQLLAADLSAGHHQFTWNGKDDAGSSLASGTYRVLIRAGDELRSLAVTLVK